MGNADELLVDIRRARHDLDVALGALARAAEGDSNDAEIDAGQDVASEAAHLSGLVGQLDDHMNSGANPPADWPMPAGHILPAGWRDLLHRAILASGVATATGVNLGAVSNAESMANAIAAQIIRERD